jgi:hypothetical protein
LAISAIAAIGLFKTLRVNQIQADAAQGQLNAMKDDQRAWLTVDDVQIIAPLTFSTAKGWQTTLRYTIKNIGKTPAFDSDGGSDFRLRTGLRMDFGGSKGVMLGSGR